VIFGVLALLPGNVVEVMLGETASPEAVAALTHKLGLDQPAWQRYLHWLHGLFTGDLGMSVAYDTPVSELLAERLAVTVPLALMAMALSTVLALGFGLYAASRHNRLGDVGVMAASQVGIALPSFWLAIMLILLMAGILNLLPTSGRSTYGVAGPEQTGFYILDSLLQQNWQAAWDGLRHILLPALALGVNMLGILMRVTRSAILEVMNEEYVTTARAKGLPERKVVWRHVTSNALIPVITVVGLELGTLLSGSIIVETVFVLICADKEINKFH